MGRIVVSENVSLDGVIQDPNGDEGYIHGGWFAQIADADREAWAEAAFEEALNAQALLFGRRSYQFFAALWPFRSGQFAERLNNMPKYVVSSTLSNCEWNNSTILKGNVVTAVSDLKREFSGDIVVYASFKLVHTLIEHDLIDEFRMTIYPFVLGTGERLFDETSDKKPLRLLDSRTIGAGLAHLAYELARDA
jgi:dihydrofolate reductase